MNWIARRAASRAILGLTVVILAATALAGHWPGAAQASSSPAPDPNRIGPGVREALETAGQAHVVIALIDPAALRAARIDLVALREQVAQIQEEVLAVLTPADYTPRLRYQAVPALAGTLHSQAGLDVLAAHPAVVRVDLDVGGRGGLAQSVPLIGADDWQALGVTGEGVVAAILDSGLDTDHDDLADDLIHQECFLDNDGLINGSGLCPNGSDRQSGAGAAEDDAGHGTHVTGIVTSNGTQSSIGVAPDTEIVSIKVTAGPSFSGVFFFFSEIVAALDYVINNQPDVQVINMSLGTFDTFAGDCDNSTSYNMAGAAAINTLRANGVIAFASAGNNGSGTIMTSPACLSNVVSVGATDDSDVVASFSNSNSATDIMAPGVDTVSDAIGNGTTSASGTSMASPHAAGCAALFIQSNEANTPDEIEARLEDSAVQVTAATNGLTFPRIDCTPRPPAMLGVSGPITGTTGMAYTFTATASPMTAALPMTYTWLATSQPGVVNSSGLSHTVSYSWTLAGSQTLTVTAQNNAGIVTATHSITISPALQFVYLPVLARNAALPRTAQVDTGPVRGAWPEWAAIITLFGGSIVVLRTNRRRPPGSRRSSPQSGNAHPERPDLRVDDSKQISQPSAE